MRQRAEERRLVAGEILIEEGAPATHFSLLLEGEVSVSKKATSNALLSPAIARAHFSGKCPYCSMSPTS